MWCQFDTTFLEKVLDVLHLSWLLTRAEVCDIIWVQSEGEIAMKKFDVIFNALSCANCIVIDEWNDETEPFYGLIQFYSHDTGKTYRMLWDNDTIIEFREVT